MAKFCKDCGSSNLIEQNQTFKDNTTHIRLVCGDCGHFNGYKKQHNGFDKLLVKDFNISCGNDVDMAMLCAGNGLKELDVLGRSITLIAKVR